MAARGALAKEQIFKKIVETFDGAFIYNNGKEVRIPWDEGNGEVQIKVTLTAAKDNVSPDGEIEIAAAAVENITESSFPMPKPAAANSLKQPSEEEKRNVEELLKSLDLI